MNQNSRIRSNVLSAPIDVLTWESSLFRIHQWATRRESRYVCLCNVHSVVTAVKDEHFQQLLAGSDMATPDGMPVAWMLRFLGFPNQQRINGPDLMWKYCEKFANGEESIFLYGGKQETLEILQRVLTDAFPRLVIAGAHSPHFRELTIDEDNEVVEMINASGAGTVWVSLGCPKQEKWIAAHKGRINAVMIGVGAAFNYHAGNIKRAPLWMQNCGLEWLHRMLSEPSRLWKRYLVTNVHFIYAASKQLLMSKLKKIVIFSRST